MINSERNNVDNFAILKTIAALILISGISFLISRYARRIFPKSFESFEGDIKIVEQKYLSSKHKIVVVNYQNTKYVLLLGESETLIDKIST